MNERKELIEAAEKLSVAEVIKYVQSRGWNSVVGANGDIIVFGHQSHGLRQLIVPKRRTADYAEAIVEVLIRLEACEGRSMCDIAYDMRKRRKVGLSFKVRLRPAAEWQRRPEFSRQFGYFAWLFVWLNFSWEYDD